MKRILRVAGWIGQSVAGVLLAVALIVAAVALAPRVGAQSLAQLVATGLHNYVRVPAYLKFVNITTNTTTVVTLKPAVLGCVIINTGGATTPTVKLYNNSVGSAIAATLIGTINSDTAGREMCYGHILTGGLTVVTASGGAAADVTVTWQGN